ncbi:MAG: ribose 5-phosphate isomerase A [Nitrososphaeraceae archaeon]
MNYNEKNDQSNKDNKYVSLSQDFFRKYIIEGSTIGLGSGSTVEKIVRNFGILEFKDTLEFIVTSLQIRIVAESLGLKIIDENKSGKIDVVLDGADQIDSDYNMIKGGGGALLKEKILIASSQKFVIIAQANKFVDRFNIAIPVEVTPFGRNFVMKELKRIGGLPSIRLLDKGYPFITENGNIIYDTVLPKLDNVKETERDIKNIPGVVEVGLFTFHANSYYKITGDNDFEIMMPKR